MGLIYLAKNKINGKVYIGQTIKTLDARKKGHINGSKTSSNGMMFLNALRKYGEGNFEWSILEENIPKEILDDREKFYIASYDSTNKINGYNICSGGNSCNATPAFCESIRKSKLNAGLRKDNKSGFKGVYKSHGRRWIAEINKKKIGAFESPIDAAKAYDETVLQMFGEGNVSTNKSLGLLDNVDIENIELTSYKINKNNKSGYIGVSWASITNCWQSESRAKHFGFYENAKDAAIAYDLSVKELFGETKRTNLTMHLLTEEDLKTRPRKKLKASNKSGYKGLYFRKNRKVWVYEFKKDGKIFRKHFKIKDDAIKFIEDMEKLNG